MLWLCFCQVSMSSRLEFLHVVPTYLPSKHVIQTDWCFRVHFEILQYLVESSDFRMKHTQYLSSKSTSDARLCLKSSRFGVLLPPLLIWLTILHDQSYNNQVIEVNCDYNTNYRYRNWTSLLVRSTFTVDTL